MNRVVTSLKAWLAKSRVKKAGEHIFASGTSMSHTLLVTVDPSYTYKYLTLNKCDANNVMHCVIHNVTHTM